MIAKKKAGGSRVNSGRKGLGDKKKQAIFIYVPGFQIEAIGGKESVKLFAEAAISRKASACIK